MKHKLKYLSILPLLLVAVGVIQVRHSSAASTIIVNSKGDVSANDGVCTLREAIEAANTDTASGAAAGECIAGSGTDTINFAITGGADFTNGGQNGYKIMPTTLLPDISEPVTINGYSQTGALANTTVSPQPFNARILIELDNSDTLDGIALQFNGNSGGSTLKGFSIYGSVDAGGGVALLAPNIKIQGNYIGPDHTGLVKKGNCVGVMGSNGGGTGDQSGANALIGGLNPADRNIISGNDSLTCGYPSGSYPVNGWTVQGNYIGLAADGLTAMGNSSTGGSGGFSIDIATGVTVGGNTPAAGNVISGNHGGGIAPDNAPGLLVQNNYFGVGYDGVTPVANGGGGIVSANTTGVSILDNIFGADGHDGIYLNNDDTVTITGNHVGTDSTNTVDFGIVQSGIAIQDSTNVTIGGAGSLKNTIKFATQSGINIDGSSNIQILHNDVQSNHENGITIQNSSDVTVKTNDLSANGQRGIFLGNGASGIMIGGVNSADSNTIHNNGRAGIASDSNPPYNQLYTVLRNSIYSNAELGIGLSNTATPLANDAADADTGQNGLLNYPRWYDQIESGGNTTIKYNLDVPAGDYRIEFYSNTTADPSGNGEGQTFIGSQNVTSNGSGVESFTGLVSGVGYTNLALTATEIKPLSSTGYGATSEFGNFQAPTVDLATTLTIVDPHSPETNGTVQYLLTITNNGPYPAQLTDYDGSNSNLLFYGFLDPSLTFDSVSGLVDCVGPFQAGNVLGSAVANHSTYNALGCFYTGPSQLLNAGESIQTTISATVSQPLPASFESFILQPANQNGSDPQTNDLGTAFGSGGDSIDYFTDNPNNNFAAAIWPVPVVPVAPTTSTSTPSLASQLANTGENSKLLVAGAVVLMVAGGTILVKKRR